MLLVAVLLPADLNEENSYIAEMSKTGFYSFFNSFFLILIISDSPVGGKRSTFKQIPNSTRLSIRNWMRFPFVI